MQTLLLPIASAILFLPAMLALGSALEHVSTLQIGGFLVTVGLALAFIGQALPRKERN